jgi:hypothetical protein
MRLIAGMVAASCIAFTGCVSVELDRSSASVVRTETDAIELGSAEMVRVEVSIPAGELRIEDGGSRLLDASFRYTTPFRKPEVRYTATGFRGHLTISQSGANLGLNGNIQNEWKLQLGSAAPMDIELNMGAGESRLRLGHLNLRRVQAKLGAGEVHLDLRGGNPQRDYDVEVRGGVGEAHVYLPSNVGVIAEASGGLGEISVRGLRKQHGAYVNDLYGKSRVTIRVDVKGGIGEIHLSAE